MVPLASLWLPILLSAVLVFIASAVLHMVLRYHNTDFAKLPNEDAVMDVLRGTAPGEYMAPHSTGAEGMKDPVFVVKMTRGPIAIVTVLPSGPPNMGKPLSQWFVYTLVVSTLAAYVAGRALGPGVEYLQVFRFAG